MLDSIIRAQVVKCVAVDNGGRGRGGEGGREGGGEIAASRSKWKNVKLFCVVLWEGKGKGSWWGRERTLVLRRRTTTRGRRGGNTTQTEVCSKDRGRCNAG